MYDESKLSRLDKQFLDGFDWAIEMAVDNFFENNYQKGLDDDSYIGHFMCSEAPENLKSETNIEFKYMNGRTETRRIETVADYIRDFLLDWCDSMRNDLITSMIDSDEEYGEED